MDTFFFRIFFSVFKLLRFADVNSDHVQMIASTKLLMDRRRTPATWRRGQQKETSNGMLMALFFYALMGLFIGLLVFNVPSLMVIMIILHSYLMFMIIMTLITDFSNVLLDTSDAQIILPKPVSSRTLLVARTLHIMVYMGQLLFAIMVFPLLFTFIKYGPLVGLASILTTLLTTSIGIFLTYILYGLVLRYTSEQKVKDIIGYFQIFMTIFFAVGYQLIPRMIGLNDLNFNFELRWYTYLLPPVWMGGLIEATNTRIVDTAHLALMACAIGVPAIAGFIIVKYLAPYFSKFMSAPEGGATTLNVAHREEKRSSLSEKISTLICRKGCEQAGFAQVWKITGRDKNFKMQFYPTLAYIPVFVFIIFFKNFKNVSGVVESLPNGNMFLWLLYMGMFAVLMSLALTSFSENYSASWIYQSAPIKRPGELISGSAKALLVKFFLPVFFILSAITIVIWGSPVIDDILLALTNSVLIFYFNALLSKHYLPFSQKTNVKEQTGKFALIVIRFLLMAVLVGMHWMAIKIGWLIWLLIPVSMAGCCFAEKKMSSLDWDKIIL